MNEKYKHLNIVTVICHDLGRHLGCYGRKDVRSPHIDAFAASGLRFANSFCTAPQCSPSRAALWTGRFAHANGVVGLAGMGFGNDLHPGEKHLAQILAEAGYETRLFGIQHESPRAERCGYQHVHPLKPCGELAQDFSDFLSQRQNSNQPLFAQIGFVEPHRPFPREGVELLRPEEMDIPPYLPDIPEVREDLAAMEASIASADLAFGRILESIRASEMADNTLVVFTADHGIPFPRAKMSLYDPGLEVPLIFSGPGIPQGTVQDELTSNVDVLPTLLELCGLPVPANLHGRSLAALIENKPHVPNEMIFAEKTYHTYYDPMRSVRTKRWKLIANFEFAPSLETAPDYHNNGKGYVEVSKAWNLPWHLQYHPPFELYDLEKDPWEQQNLADDPKFREIRDGLISSLRKWMEDTRDPLLDGPIAQGVFLQRMAEFKRINP